MPSVFQGDFACQDIYFSQSPGNCGVDPIMTMTYATMKNKEVEEERVLEGKLFGSKLLSLEGD